MSKFVLITRKTMFPVILVLSVLLFILVKAPALRERDVQIKENAEAAASFKKGEKIIQGTETSIILWDGDGRIFSVSPQAAHDLRSRVEDLEGKPISEVVNIDTEITVVLGHPELEAVVEKKIGKGGVAILRLKKEDPNRKKIEDLENELDKVKKISPTKPWE